MATSTGSGSPSLDTINNIFGTSLEFPKCFRKPGTTSSFELKSGSGQFGYDGAAATFTLNPTSPISTQTIGLANDVGMRNIQGALTVTGQTLFLGGFKGETAYWSLNSATWAITSGGSASITSGKGVSINAGTDVSIESASAVNITGASINISSAGSLMVAGIGDLISVVNSKKGFDILHPNKKNYRLRHICVEGPEAAVYIRGKLQGKNIIELPDYWNGLVDMDTISVQLTQIGYSQDLIVEEINNNQVKIKSGNGTSIHCYYQVWADRLGEKLIVEYEGKTPKDYPGDNSEYSLAGWDYDRRIKK